MKQKSFFLLAMLLVAFAGNAQNSSDFDHNGDGAVDLSDVSILIDYILNPPGFANQTFTVKGVNFDMIAVEGGTFTMGATEEQGSEAYNDEKPTHPVTLSSYYIGKTEVTQELWEAVMGSNPSWFKDSDFNDPNFKDPKLPVEQVSWNDCQTFITKLNALTGKNFRLPTEAEWEFAARGGNKSKGYKYSGSNTIVDVAWYISNSNYASCPVATKAPNELGIYDMSGNVWEWCSDWFGNYSSESQTNPTGPKGASSRVFRGGGWYSDTRYCRVAYRGNNTPDYINSYLGLRLCLSEAQNNSDFDHNGDGAVDLSDVAILIDYILYPPGFANQTFTVKGVNFEMVAVDGGTFTMGATEEQGSAAENDEKPTHPVTLSSYYIGKTEVTQELWEAVMGSNPSWFKDSDFNDPNFKDPKLPVEQVSWNDCQTFITKLNALTGKNFRLPTEAEWEFAARGGNKSKGYKYSGSNTIVDVAWYISNSNYASCPVATKAPNELGIYDMSGNVWEWCSDWFGNYSSESQTNPTGPKSGSYRVERGGCWYCNTRYCRVSYRGNYPPNYINEYLGLRLCLSE